jgi:PAS domain S-box-containing protein
VNQLIVRETSRERLLKGVCSNLVETRGYVNAWVVVLDPVGRFVTAAEAGLGDRFAPLLRDLERNLLPGCVNDALARTDVVVRATLHDECPACPVADHKGRAGMAVRIEHAGRTYGALVVSTSYGPDIGDEERALFQEVGDDIGMALRAIESEEDRRWALEALRASEERFAKAFRASPDALAISRAGDDRIIELNDSWERLFGIPREEAIGRSPIELGFYVNPADHQRAMAQVDAKGEARDFEITIRTGAVSRPDGEIRQVSLSIEPIELAGGMGILTITRDITEQKTAEREILRRRAVSEAVNQLLHEALVCQSDADVARVCLTLAEQVTGSKFGLIHEVNTAGNPGH